MSDDMIDVEMAQTAKQIVEKSLDIGSGETVLIVTDPKKVSVAKSLTIAARSVGATAITSIMPLLESHGNEPPKTISVGMMEADAVITCTTHAISHTEARRQAAANGVKIGVLRGVTTDMMIKGAISVDYEELKETTDKLVKILSKASNVKVTSDNGTDIEFSIEGSEAQPVDGFYHADTDNPVASGASFPPGEAPILPTEGTANGNIVIDVSIDNIGKLNNPIEIEFEEGFAKEVKGGDEAAELQEILDTNGKNTRNLAEFAIGTNKKAKLIGNLAEDKKKEGTVHFALGDNISLGGEIESNIHLDGVIRFPSVYVDSNLIVEDGNILYDEL